MRVPSREKALPAILTIALNGPSNITTLSRALPPIVNEIWEKNYNNETFRIILGRDVIPFLISKKLVSIQPLNNKEKKIELTPLGLEFVFHLIDNYYDTFDSFDYEIERRFLKSFIIEQRRLGFDGFLELMYYLTDMVYSDSFTERVRRELRIPYERFEIVPEVANPKYIYRYFSRSKTKNNLIRNITIVNLRDSIYYSEEIIDLILKTIKKQHPFLENKEMIQYLSIEVLSFIRKLYEEELVDKSYLSPINDVPEIDEILEKKIYSYGINLKKTIVYGAIQKLEENLRFLQYSPMYLFNLISKQEETFIPEEKRKELNEYIEKLYGVCLDILFLLSKKGMEPH